MARKAPPAGKGGLLAAQERLVTPKKLIPVKTKDKTRVKRAPAHVPTAAPRTETRSLVPPSAVNTARLEPARTVEKRRQNTPFFPGQKPSYHERVPTAGRGPRTAGKTRPVYELTPGPTGGELGLNAAQLASAAQIRQQVQGKPGVIFRDITESLVPRTFVDVGLGRKVKGETLALDALDQLLNFAGPGLAGVVFRGGKVARAAVKGVKEGKSIGEAAAAAAEIAAPAKAAKKAAAAVERDAGPALRAHDARRLVHAEIDAQLGRGAKAEKVKSALDDAALLHAEAAKKSEGVTLKQARRDAAVKWYDDFAEEATPRPGAPRTFAQAQVRFDQLNERIEAFIDKVADKVGHPSGMSVKDLVDEQLARNTRNGKRLQARSGVNKAGNARGSVSPWKSQLEPLVADEIRRHAEETVDRLVAAHPDVPEFKAYARMVEERDELQRAITQHQENRVFGDEEPVDFGVHPGVAPTPEQAVAVPDRTTVPESGPGPLNEAPPEVTPEVTSDVTSRAPETELEHLQYERDQWQQQLDVAEQNLADPDFAKYPGNVAAGESGYRQAAANLARLDERIAAHTEEKLRNEYLTLVNSDSIQGAEWDRIAELEQQLGIKRGTPYVKPEDVPPTVDAVTDPPGPAFDPAQQAAEERELERAEEWQHEIQQQLALDIEAATQQEQGYAARTLMVGSLPVQIPKARRSRILGPLHPTQYIERLADQVSNHLDDAAIRGHFITDIRGVRLMTSTDRGSKYAGRAQRQRHAERLSEMGSAMQDLAKVKSGSADDMALFWYAQLPDAYRNADGLRLIHEMQTEELRRIRSGEAQQSLEDRLTALRIETRRVQEDPDGKIGPLLKEQDETKMAIRDLPHRRDDVAASIAKLEELIIDPPQMTERMTAALEAMRTMSADRRRILEEGGRLDAERADERVGLLARAVGLEPDGTEIYVGHRLPKPERNGASFTPSVGGTGRPASPQGAGTRNALVLARTGRLKATARVTYEDWQSATVFEQAMDARHDLGRMGVPYRGGPIPEGYLLVNPKGRTIPAHWKSEELAQFRDDHIDRDEIRTQAREVLYGFLAEDQDHIDEMLNAAREAQQPISDLRLVPARNVERYYSQFRSFKGRSSIAKAYDMGIDAVATSIIFARVGYIPKNLVQNVIMSVPHQGAFFLQNVAKATQVLNDRELRHLVKGQIGGTGATGALASEAGVHRVLTKSVNFVTEVADDPARVAAWLHEAQAAGVIPRHHLLLTAGDKKKLVAFLTHKTNVQLRRDIRSRTVDAMADFTRMTPDQAKTARRVLIIPGWLMAGSRYPFHFAATHPVRSALIAYIALGEPGAPDELQFNQPVTHYFSGSRFLRGIDTRWGRERTASLNPVSTPWELAHQAYGSVKGKKNPFDYETETAFDVANPLLATGVRIAQGEGKPGLGGRLRELERLVPAVQLGEALVSPHETSRYPDDATRAGRLKREVGILPIHVNDVVPRKRRRRKGKGGFAPTPDGGGTSAPTPGGGGGGFAPTPGG